MTPCLEEILRLRLMFKRVHVVWYYKTQNTPKSFKYLLIGKIGTGFMPNFGENWKNRCLTRPPRKPEAQRHYRRPDHQPSGVGGVQVKRGLQMQQNHAAI